MQCLGPAGTHAASRLRAASTGRACGQAAKRQGGQGRQWLQLPLVEAAGAQPAAHGGPRIAGVAPLKQDGLHVLDAAVQGQGSGSLCSSRRRADKGRLGRAGWAHGPARAVDVYRCHGQCSWQCEPYPYAAIRRTFQRSVGSQGQACRAVHTCGPYQGVSYCPPSRAAQPWRETGSTRVGRSAACSSSCDTGRGG